MTTGTIACCARCHHGDERPCNRFVECWSEGPLCHEGPACRERRRERTAAARFAGEARPVVLVGAGTCGLGAGAGKVLQAVKGHLAARGLDAVVLEVGCIGLCTAEPMVDVSPPGRARLSFGNVRAEEAGALLDAVLAGSPPPGRALYQMPAPGRAAWPGVPAQDAHPFFASQKRVVLENCGVLDPGSVDAYLAAGGYRGLARALSTHTREELCDLVETSGLRGRGGGGFPTGKKWKLALARKADRKYFICNADEGDPGAFMDRAVIEGDPHRLIEGIAIATYAIGATKAIVYIRAEYPLAIARLKAAIAQAERLGLLGYNVLDSGWNFQVAIKQGAGAFVCGEETALMHSIEGKRGMPRLRPPFPAQSGLEGRPTIINNVETAANLPPIVRNGADWFAAMGTAGSKGTKVFALSGRVRNTGLVEIEMGRSVRDVVFTIGGGVPDGHAFKAVQIGGPSGGCIPEEHLDIPVDYESLKTVGAIMGSGGLVVMDERTCMVDLARFFMGFIQRESCGKCIPCREGTKRMLEILDAICEPNKPGSDPLRRFAGVLALEELGGVIQDASLCGLGQTAPNPVLSTLRWFRAEYEAHVYDRRCPAGVCRGLLRYAIDPGKCKGCTVCAKKCRAGAIEGAAKAAHRIVEAKCLGCGLCVEVCRFDAVTVG